jgi:hypothetical protein
MCVPNLGDVTGFCQLDAPCNLSPRHLCKPIPSDHAPLVIDLDRPGHLFEAGWAAAEARIASRGTRLATPDSSEQPS